MKLMQKITPCLWFDGKAEEAANFYTGIFRNSRIGEVMRCGDAGPGPRGSVLAVEFQLEGQDFIALNGGPMFSYSPAISLFVNCETQEEIDALWEKLLQGGEPRQCGWLTDRYGVSWQIVPTLLGVLLKDRDADKAGRVMAAMLKMVKLDIGSLKQAYENA